MENDLKILVIEGRKTIGGGQVVTKAVCDSLSDNHHIAVFLPGDKNSPVAKMLDNYRHFYFQQREYSRGKKGVADFCRFVCNFVSSFSLRNVITKNKFDVLYVQHASMLPVVLLACVGIQINIIVHLHVVYIDKYVRWLMNRMLTSQKIKIVFGVSDYTFSKLSSQVLPKCILLYNPIPTYAKQMSRSRTGGIAIIGDVAPFKGHHILFQAISMLGVGYKIHVVGNVVDKGYENRLRCDYPQVDCVFTGMLSDVHAYINEHQIDMTIVASVMPFETFSLAMVESWAQGIPTIATNDFGMKELVNKFVPQYAKNMLFEKENSKDLAEKIRLLETDTVLYNKISQDVKFVVDTYLSQISFSKNINKFLAVI